MLSSDREKWGVGLKTGLHQEERGAKGGSYNAGGGTGEDIDADGLHLSIIVNRSRDGFAHGLVEP